MIQKDPAARLTAREYLDLQRDKAFPEYFYSFLNDYMKAFSSIPRLPDEKIHLYVVFICISPKHHSIKL